MDFCKQFNERTQSQAGYIIPVVIDVYEDRSFTFVTKSPPAAVLIKKALNLPKGSAAPNKTKVGQITKAQLEEIAKTKMEDLNATTLEAAVDMIKGTARAMGVTVAEQIRWEAALPYQSLKALKSIKKTAVNTTKGEKMSKLTKKQN